MTEHDRAIAALERADRRLFPGPRASLCPERPRATSFAALGRALLHRDISEALGLTFASELERIGDSIRQHFPDNLFWDFDLLAASLLGHEERLGEAAAIVVRLHELFGTHTPIRFRYVHDFIYGYDWAKWVGRDPDARADNGPYSLEFLRDLEQRGHELLGLIASDDEKYPALAADELARNPFPFSREPEAESRLHRELGRRCLLPVEAWRVDAAPRAGRPFARLREECARELGLLAG
jgi:hypothetical protein